MKNIIRTFMGIWRPLLLFGLHLGYTKFCCFLCEYRQESSLH